MFNANAVHKIICRQHSNNFQAYFGNKNLNLGSLVPVF